MTKDGRYHADLARRYSLDLLTDQERESWLYATMLRVCGNVEGLKVLDVGCGAGTSSRPLARRGARVIGIDASAEQIALAFELEAREQLDIKYLQVPLAELQVIDPEGFDLVTAVFILHYAHTPEELQAMFRGLYANLKPKGRMVALIINPANPLELGSDFPMKAEHTWVNPEHAWQDGAEIKIQVYDSSEEPIPPFIVFYYSQQTYETQANAAGFSELLFHPTQPPEQKSAVVFEAFRN